MMTKPQLWQLLVERNPQFDTQCTFKAGQVRKLFDLVWDQAAQENTPKQGRGRRFDDMFGGVFGG